MTKGQEGSPNSGPGEARTILPLHIISARPSKQPLMVRTFLKVYMELGSYFLFLQETSKRHHHHHRWFNMVDWRSANVGSDQSGVRRSIEGYRKKLEVEAHRQHPDTLGRTAGTKITGKEPERTSTTHECASQLSQLVSELQQHVTGTVTEIDWRAADPSRHPQNACRGLARLLSRGDVSCESARWLAKQIGDRLPLGSGVDRQGV